MVSCNRLWVGTGNGVIISIPLTESKYLFTCHSYREHWCPEFRQKELFWYWQLYGHSKDQAGGKDLTVVPSLLL